MLHCVKGGSELRKRLSAGGKKVSSPSSTIHIQQQQREHFTTAGPRCTFIEVRGKIRSMELMFKYPMELASKSAAQGDVVLDVVRLRHIFAIILNLVSMIAHQMLPRCQLST